MWPHMASLREWPHGLRSSICVRLRRLRDHPTLFRMTHDSLMGRRHALSADPRMDTLEERPGDRDTVDPTATRQSGARFQSIRTESYQARASANAAGSVQINPPWQR